MGATMTSQERALLLKSQIAYMLDDFTTAEMLAALHSLARERRDDAIKLSSFYAAGGRVEEERECKLMTVLHHAAVACRMIEESN